MTTRAEKVFEYATKAITRTKHCINEAQEGNDTLREVVLSKTLAMFEQMAFKDKEAAWNFTNMILMPFWDTKEESFDEERFIKENRKHAMETLITLIKEHPQLAEEVDAMDGSVLHTIENYTRFLFPYFTAMCDYATTQ